MKGTILYLYTKHIAGTAASFSDKKYQRCYEVLYEMAEKRGLAICRAPFGWFDSKKKHFKKTWRYVNKKWELTGPVQPDLVYDKASPLPKYQKMRERLAKNFPFINNPGFTRIASSKYETSRLLPQYFKPYVKVQSQKSLLAILDSLPGEWVAIKPDIGSGGKAVLVIPKTEARALKISFPCIVQEFIDSSHGIPGITAGLHDLRLTFFNDELIFTYIRVPKKGSFLANVAQGGKMFIVPNEKLPSSVIPVIEDTQKVFAQFSPKVYTIDLMFDENQRPWIVELNTMPGMYFPDKQWGTMKQVYKKFLDFLIEALDSQKR